MQFATLKIKQKANKTMISKKISNTQKYAVELNKKKKNDKAEGVEKKIKIKLVPRFCPSRMKLPREREKKEE